MPIMGSADAEHIQNAPSLMAGTKENKMSKDAVKTSDKIQLGKVEVKMGARTVDLTVDQARELCALLKALFGDDTTKMVHVHDYWYRRPWYMGPTWRYSGANWSATANTTTGTFTLCSVNNSG